MKRSIKLLLSIAVAVFLVSVAFVISNAAETPSVDSFEVKVQDFNSVTLSWTTGEIPVTGVKIYKYRKSDKSNTLLATLKKGETEFTVEKLLSGTDYCFKIKAYTKSGAEIIHSKTKKLNTFTLIPQVNNLTLKSNSDTSQEITWDSIKGINTYRIYFLKKSTGKYTLLGTKTGNSAIVTCNPGTKYTYKVKGIAKVNSGKKTIAGKASNSLKAVTKSAFISTMNISNTTDSSVRFTWTAGKNVAGYKIYQYDLSQKKYKAVKKITDGTSATISKLPSAKSVKFRIKSFSMIDGKAVFSDASAPVKVVTKPTHVTVRQEADEANNREAVISWTKAPRVTGYLIYVSEHKNSGFALFSETPSSSLKTTLKGLKNGVPQYIKIKAYCVADGKKTYGEYSNMITVYA